MSKFVQFGLMLRSCVTWFFLVPWTKTTLQKAKWTMAFEDGWRFAVPTCIEDQEFETNVLKGKSRSWAFLFHNVEVSAIIT